MKRVTGIGGIFFKAKDAPALQAWYKQHLGIDVQPWGGAAFDWTDEGHRGVGERGRVVYELHVGTFTREGTWEAARAHLPELALGEVFETLPVALVVEEGMT